MGAYLSQPVKEKESSDGGNARVKFGTSAMQGWRTSMEVSETLSEFVFKAFVCVFVFCVLCVGVGVGKGGVRRQHFLPWSSFGRVFFFQSTKKLRKQKMKESSSSSPSSFVTFFFPFVVPRMDGCLSSFVVVRRRSFSKHRLLTCFGFLCIVSSSL